MKKRMKKPKVDVSLEGYKQIVLRIAEESQSDGLLILSAKVAYHHGMRDYKAKANGQLLERVASKYAEQDSKAGFVAREILTELRKNGAFRFFHNENYYIVFRRSLSQGAVDNADFVRMVFTKSRLYMSEIEFTDELVELLEDNI